MVVEKLLLLLSLLLTQALHQNRIAKLLCELVDLTQASEALVQHVIDVVDNHVHKLNEELCIDASLLGQVFAVDGVDPNTLDDLQAQEN